jgi:hypothetical protein
MAASAAKQSFGVIGNVCSWRQGGKHLLALSFSGFDPYRKSSLASFGICQPFVAYWTVAG